MTKPIYRHLADLSWRSYKRKLLIQRITQMTVVPDVLPAIDPIVSTSLSFGKKKVPHGDFVDSLISERAPDIVIQPYNPGERLVTIAVVNPDVPNVAKDGFDYRCHFLASNIRISPTDTFVSLGRLDPETQVILPWLPPYAQKGAPYQRMSVFVLEQPASEASIATEPSDDTTPTTTSSSRTHPLSLPPIKASPRYTKRDNFILRSLVSKYRLHPVGVDLFRCRWDEGTQEVMQRAGVVGADVEFRRKRVEPLPYRRLKAERYR